MAIVAGVDFGTLSVRVSLVDSETRLDRLRQRRVPAAPQARRSGIRHPVSRRAHACPGRRDARSSEKDRHCGRSSAGHRARHYRFVCDSRRQRSCNLSANIICGAITAPKAKRPRSRKRHTASSWRPFNGAAEFTRRSGDFRSCCTGSGTIPISDRSLLPHLSIVTW